MRKKSNLSPENTAEDSTVSPVPADSFQRMVGIRDVAAGLSVYEVQAESDYDKEDDSQFGRYTEEYYEIGDLTVTIDLNYRFSLSNRGVSDQYTIFEQYVDVGDTVYAVIERYDDYDTFGHRHGLAKILSVHATEKAADAAMRAAWATYRMNPRGWGFSLLDYSIHTTQVI